MTAVQLHRPTASSAKLLSVRVETSLRGAFADRKTFASLYPSPARAYGFILRTWLQTNSDNKLPLCLCHHHHALRCCAEPSPFCSQRSDIRKKSAPHRKTSIFQITPTKSRGDLNMSEGKSCGAPPSRADFELNLNISRFHDESLILVKTPNDKRVWQLPEDIEFGDAIDSLVRDIVQRQAGQVSP